MTSSISTLNIDETFPIAGQDNNSQGFRTNFTEIKTALDTAGSEITTLQNNTAKLNVDNDFNGHLLENAEVNKFYGSVRNSGTITTNTDVDIENGPCQIYTLGGNVTLRFTNWPGSDLYSKVRLHLKGDTVSVRTVVFGTEGGGTIVKAGDGGAFPSPFTLAVTGKFKVVEAWTYNGGSTVFMKYLGEFV